MKDKILSFVDRVSRKQETVTIVGSGITALMSAWEAQKADYKVNVISQSPDPRDMAKAANQQPQFSATFDGQDQRYITLFEGHPYLELLEYVQAVYPNIGDDFMKPVLKGGMLAKPAEDFSPRNQRWLLEREKINNELKGNNEQLKAKVKTLFATYAQENRAAMQKWYDFIGVLLEADPSLAKKISLSTNGIMRLYDNADVLAKSEETHKAGGVFKKRYTPDELKTEFSAYAAGVDNGFIQGGAVEMHGLTLGVKTIGEAMVRILAEDKDNPVQFTFNKRVENPVVNDRGMVEGLLLADGSVVKSKHYILHPGAMGLPGLYKEAAPEVQDTMAAMEGYWITIDGADEIIKQMRGKPNKVHGKQSIKALLDKVDAESREKFTTIFHDLGVTDFENNAPIVDFNIMPIYSQDGKKVTLGVGSGYIFKGLSEPDARGFPTFEGDKEKRSEKFVLALMELWLEVLYGKELLRTGQMTVWETGCKRSWTIDDKEVDKNIVTADGGLLAIRGGGNTGDTTKSTFVADYNIRLLQEMDNFQSTGTLLPEMSGILQSRINHMAPIIRASIRKPGVVDFEMLTAELKANVEAAERNAAIAKISHRSEGPDSGATRASGA